MCVTKEHTNTHGDIHIINTWLLCTYTYIVTRVCTHTHIVTCSYTMNTQERHGDIYNYIYNYI